MGAGLPRRGRGGAPLRWGLGLAAAGGSRFRPRFSQPLSLKPPPRARAPVLTGPGAPVCIYIGKKATRMHTLSHVFSQGFLLNYLWIKKKQKTKNKKTVKTLWGKKRENSEVWFSAHARVVGARGGASCEAPAKRKRTGGEGVGGPGWRVQNGGAARNGSPCPCTLKVPAHSSPLTETTPGDGRQLPLPPAQGHWGSRDSRGRKVQARGSWSRATSPALPVSPSSQPIPSTRGVREVTGFKVMWLISGGPRRPASDLAEAQSR